MTIKHKIAIILGTAFFFIPLITNAFTPPQSCLGGQFFNSLNSGGTFICATPSGGGGGGSTTISTPITPYSFPYLVSSTILSGSSTLSYSSSTGNINIIGSSSVNGVTGLFIQDSAYTTNSNILMGSLKFTTFVEPQIWMGSYATAPNSTNYVFGLDDNGNGGTIFNAPGTNNISFRINNSAVMKINGTTGNVGIGTGDSPASSTLQVNGIITQASGTNSLASTTINGILTAASLQVTTTSTLGGTLVMSSTASNRITSNNSNLTILGNTVFLQNASRTSLFSINPTGAFTIEPSFSSGTRFFDVTSGDFVSLDTSLLTGNTNLQIPNSSGILCTTATCTGGGSGSGNLFVSPTSTTIGNNLIKFQTSGSSTVAQTSSLYSFADGNLSVNTSTEKGAVNIVNLTTGIPIFQASTSTLATSSVSLGVLGASSTASSNFSVFQILGDGHVNSTGTVPVLSSCGTSPTIVGSDAWGTVTVGSVTATSCTITFQIPYEATPSVIISSETSLTSQPSYTISTTALTITDVGSLVGDKIHYFVGLNL